MKQILTLCQRKVGLADYSRESADYSAELPISRVRIEVLAFAAGETGLNGVQQI